MWFYWIQDQVQQGQFHIFWQPSNTNCPDYFTKHHPAMHHQAVHASYLHIPSQHTNYYACLTDDLVPRTSEGVLIGPMAVHTQQLLQPSKNYYKVTQNLMTSHRSPRVRYPDIPLIELKVSKGT